MLKMDFELTLQSLRCNKDMLDKALDAMHLKGEIISSFSKKNTATNVEDLNIKSITEEDLIALAAEPYKIFLNFAFQINNSGMSYKERISKIQSLTEKLQNEFGFDPNSYPTMAAHPEKILTLFIIIHCAKSVTGLYQLHVDHVALQNALMTGIEVYLIKAKTGHLPEKLPEGVPRDPFTGHDFIYKITEEGFSLSLLDKNISEQIHYPYEFKVQR